MTAMIEKAINRLKTEKDQIDRLKKFKANIVERLGKNPTEKNFLRADAFYAYGSGTNNNNAFLPYELVNLLLSPAVMIPLLDSLIEKLEKSATELEDLLSVFEKAIKPVIAPV